MTHWIINRAGALILGLLIYNSHAMEPNSATDKKESIEGYSIYKIIIDKSDDNTTTEDPLEIIPDQVFDISDQKIAEDYVAKANIYTDHIQKVLPKINTLHHIKCISTAIKELQKIAPRFEKNFPQQSQEILKFIKEVSPSIVTHMIRSATYDYTYALSYLSKLINKDVTTRKDIITINLNSINLNSIFKNLCYISNDVFSDIFKEYATPQQRDNLAIMMGEIIATNARLIKKMETEFFKNEFKTMPSYAQISRYQDLLHNVCVDLGLFNEQRMNNLAKREELLLLRSHYNKTMSSLDPNRVSSQEYSPEVDYFALPHEAFSIALKHNVINPFSTIASYQMPLLEYAFREGLQDHAMALIKAGVSPFSPNKDKQPVILNALDADSKILREVFAQTVDKKALANALAKEEQNSPYSSALIVWAVFENKPHHVKILLDNGANPNTLDSRKTHIAYHALERDPTILDMLLKTTSVDPYVRIKDHRGKERSLMSWASKGEKNCAKHLQLLVEARKMRLLSKHSEKRKKTMPPYLYLYAGTPSASTAASQPSSDSSGSASLQDHKSPEKKAGK